MQGKVHAGAMAAVYVGIDVSKERLDVYLHPLGERLAVANDAGGWRHLGRKLARLAPALVVMEATSKYHRSVHRRLHAGGIEVAVVNPLRARRLLRVSDILCKRGFGSLLMKEGLDDDARDQAGAFGRAAVGAFEA